MADEFLSMTEAEKLTGTHRETIRRLVDRLKKLPEHPDRKHIRPSPAEYDQKQRTKERFSWTVSRELLEREYAPFPGQGTDEPDDKAQRPIGQELLDAKDETIAVLKQQLSNQTEQISELNERVREAHLIAATKQQQYVEIPENVRRRVEAGRQRWWDKHVYLSDLWRRRGASQNNASRPSNADAAGTRASVVDSDRGDA